MTQGKYTKVDNEDFKMFSKFKWYADKGWKTFYAVHVTSKRKEKSRKVYLHRAILWSPDKYEIDHIDGDGLNNQRKNLRIVTKSQNGQNRGPQDRNTTGFKNIHWDKSRKKYVVAIKNGENVFRKRCETLKEAKALAKEKRKEIHGVYALN